jgi:hypothetical protein
MHVPYEIFSVKHVGAAVLYRIELHYTPTPCIFFIQVPSVPPQSPGASPEKVFHKVHNSTPLLAAAQHGSYIACNISPPTKYQAIDFPCLVVNVGSGVSVLKVEEDGTYSRVSGSR